MTVVLLGLLVGALVLLGLLAVVVALSPRPDVDPGPAELLTPAVVVHVVDGDTFVCRTEGNRVLRVRCVGIDAPEVAHHGQRGQRGGRAAAAFARDVLAGQAVTLVRDVGGDDRDHYGRNLRYLVLRDGRQFGEVAARAGMVRPYVFRGRPCSRARAIECAAVDARRARRGVWAG